jgi:hypothetical protein
VVVATAWGALAVLRTSVTYDDGFYYLGIARHLAAGDGPTFDGAHFTNGFQPLWMALLVLVAWLNMIA